MKKTVLFTIVIPTFNRAHRILTTINSILAQNYYNFEIKIIDDGSTDDTKEIILALKDPRITYFKKKNEERAIARNFGIDRANGDYITFLDSDDILYPNHLEEAFNLINDYGSPEWLHLAYEIKDEKGKIIRQETKRHGNINSTLATGNHLSCIGVFIRNDIIKTFKFNEDRDIIGSEDYELWLRLAAKYTLYYSNEITSCMIQHVERSVTGFNPEKLIKRTKKLVEIVTNNQFLKKRDLRKFYAHRYLYLSLHLMMRKNILLSYKFLIIAILHFPPVLFTRKIAGILKNTRIWIF